MVGQGGNDVTWRVEWPAEAVGGRVVKIPEDDDAIRETQVPNTGEWLPWTMLLTRETGRVERVSSLKRFEQLTKAHATYTDATAEFPPTKGRRCLSGRRSTGPAWR